MKPLPNTQKSLVLRVDFSADAAWAKICAEIETPVGDFQAYVDFVSDKDFDGLTMNDLTNAEPDKLGHVFLFLVDNETFKQPHHPILVVDLEEELGQFFRVIPSEMWNVENNLSLGNMAFKEFVDAVDSGGVFRGFP